MKSHVYLYLFRIAAALSWVTTIALCVYIFGNSFLMLFTLVGICLVANGLLNMKITTGED